MKAKKSKGAKSKAARARGVFTLGLMSGTSVDAIDVSLVESNGKTDYLHLHLQFPFAPQMREEILGLIRNPETNLSHLTKVHYEIGHAFADAAEKTITAALKKKFLPSREALLAIGSHGQTVFHDPDGRRTLQIGEASLIAARTGVTTVSDFRTADTAQGGEGAPLLPWYHRRLFSAQARAGLVVHNLGGISNYTYVGPNDTIFALDTGPANCLLDGAIQHFSQGQTTFDEGGALARSGQGNEELLGWLMNQPAIEAFRKKKAPKSTGRELFSHRLLEKTLQQFGHVKPESLLNTLTHYTVELILESYRRDILKRKLPLAKVVLAGGGARNSFLASLLQEALPKVEFLTMEDYGWSSQALESQAFAVFAKEALEGNPITYSTTTGTKKPAICGKISPGRNWPI
ncbi:MAG: anhydro-N-acetylmuramic acid kinase [Proteobacteria bacterium]|nr:MAG: anhydro-N-acetylmuramic acid kinase [Pseudomonadota bacterium]